MMPKQSQKLKWVWITATTIAITFGNAYAQSEETQTTPTQGNDKAITVESPVPDLDNDPDQLGALGRIHKGEQSIAPNEYRQLMRGLRMLRSGDPKIRKGGRNLLTNMNEETDVSKFLEAMIPDWFDAQQVRESFGILWDLDRPTALRLAKKLAVSQPAVHRAEAIRLLAKAGGSSNEKIIARGFVDVASEVRIIAAVSVLQLDDVRKYTPLLIDGLSESAPSYRRVLDRCSFSCMECFTRYRWREQPKLLGHTLGRTKTIGAEHLPQGLPRTAKHAKPKPG